MRRTIASLIIYVVVCLGALATAPAIRAQQSPMEAAAAQLSGPIVHSRQRKIAIFDFTGPGDKMTELGKQLADDLSVALAKSAAKLHVEDRSRVEEEIKQDFYAPQIVLDPESLLVVAQDLRVQALVVGEISLGQDKRLSVSLKAYRADDGRGIHGIAVSFPLNEEMAKLLSIDLSDDGQPDSSKYPEAKTTGYSFPRCLVCPRADYSPEAIRERLEGTVELMAIVGADGRISNVRVVKALPAGLTAEAIKAVRRWQLQPATGPDGKPAAVRQIIMVQFRLF